MDSSNAKAGGHRAPRLSWCSEIGYAVASHACPTSRILTAESIATRSGWPSPCFSGGSDCCVRGPAPGWSSPPGPLSADAERGNEKRGSMTKDSEVLRSSPSPEGRGGQGVRTPKGRGDPKGLPYGRRG